MKYRFILIAALLLFGVSANFAGFSETEMFRVFPNPVIDKAITVQSDNDFNKIEILSIVGQIVYSEELEPSNSVRLDINLQPGVYLIKISFINMTSDTKRIWVN